MYRKSLLPNGIRVVSEAIPYVKSITLGNMFNQKIMNIGKNLKEIIVPYWYKQKYQYLANIVKIGYHFQA